MGCEHVSDDTKNLVDAVLAILGGIGAALAFLHTLETWREGQRWQRAAKLDALIEHFERDALLRLACVIIDWTSRRLELDGDTFAYTNVDALGALKLYGEGPGQTLRFTPTQAKIRDAYDAFLSFMSRLDAALEARLVDTEPAARHFRYWLEVFASMRHHPDADGSILDGKSPSQAVADYIRAYGDPAVIASLQKRFHHKTTACP